MQPPPTPSHRPWATLAPALVALALAGCGGAPPPPKTVPTGAVQRGVASWYGPKFHGRPTASGQIFDMYRLTAAHRTLPFGTRVRVTNLDNGRTTELVVNDRGPFVRGRILDVSYAAAEDLGMVGPGTARVEIRVLGTTTAAAAAMNLPAPAPGLPSGGWTVQVGAFQDLQRARRLSRKLEHLFAGVEVRTEGSWHRVQVGRFDDRESAERQARKLERRGFPAWITPAPPASP